MADNSRAVNRVFTRKVICDLIENGRSDVFDYVVKSFRHLTICWLRFAQ